MWLQANQNRGAKVKAGAGAAAKGGKAGGKGGAMVKIALEVGSKSPLFSRSKFCLLPGGDGRKETCERSVRGKLCHRHGSNSY